MATVKPSPKTAVITGASSGIGEAFAYELARDGYRLVLVSRTGDEINRVAGVIATKHDVETIGIPNDLSRPEAARELHSDIAARGIVPDLVINNAGFGIMGEVASIPLDQQLEILDVNVHALTALSTLYAIEMRNRGEGGIINVSSVGGSLPGPNMAVYYASKAYISSYTEALSVELKPYGVQVTCVVPGITKTEFHRRAGMEDAKLMNASPPMTAEQVARIGYKGFRNGKRVVVTGWQNHFANVMARFMPRFILLPVVRRLHT